MMNRLVFMQTGPSELRRFALRIDNQRWDAIDDVAHWILAKPFCQLSDDISVALPWVFNPAIEDPPIHHPKGLEKWFKSNFSVRELDSIIHKRFSSAVCVQKEEEKRLDTESLPQESPFVENRVTRSEERFIGLRTHRSAPQTGAIRPDAELVLAKYGLDRRYQPLRSQTMANATVS